MAGCRALTDVEVRIISRSFGGRYATRDKALFLVGVYTGFRISELLSLRVRDVWQYGRVTDLVRVARRYMKRKREGRTVRLHPVAQAAIAAWLDELPRPWGDETYLFRSREGENRPLQRVQAWQILHDAYVSNQLQGPLGTHSMRKTFATWAYTRSGDLVKVQALLGHADIASTGKYLTSASAEDLDAIVLSL